MASPWTSSASDNLGRGANSRPAWIVLSDTATQESYSKKDPVGDNSWPKLTPNRKSNFDIVNAEVTIAGGMPEKPVELEIAEEQMEQEIDEAPSSVEEETPAEEDTQYEEEETEEYADEREEPAKENGVTKEEIVDDVINIFKKLIKKQL